MAQPEVYRHFRPARTQDLRGVMRLFCMESRRPDIAVLEAPDARTAGPSSGLPADIALSLTVMGYGVQNVPKIAKTVKQNPSLEIIPHANHCGGDAGLVAANARIVAAGAGDILAAARVVGLDSIVTESLASQTVEAAAAYVQSGEAVHGMAQVVPSLDSLSSHARLGVRGTNQSGTIISNLTGDRFDSIAANDAGTPAYDIDFVTMGEAAYLASRGEILVDEDVFVTSMLARHWVTLAELTHPTGGDWNVLVHSQSEFEPAA